jgi:hypothetical protein
MFNKDHYLLGVFIGLTFPAALFFLIWGINYLLIQTGMVKNYIDLQRHLILSFAGNLAPIRYYFVNLACDKTGRGVLIITFACVLLFFIMKDVIFRILN